MERLGCESKDTPRSERRESDGTMSAFLKSRTGVVLLAFLAIAAFFLITEHAAHVFGVLPFVLLLLCPLSICLCTMDTAAETPRAPLASKVSALKRKNNEYELSSLRPLAARHHQLGGLHNLRLQLHAPADEA